MTLVEDIMLREISQTPKDKSCVIPLIGCLRMGKFIETESLTEISEGWRRRKGEQLFNRCRVPFERIKKFWT